MAFGGDKMSISSSTSSSEGFETDTSSASASGRVDADSDDIDDILIFFGVGEVVKSLIQMRSELIEPLSILADWSITKDRCGMNCFASLGSTAVL